MAGMMDFVDIGDGASQAAGKQPVPDDGDSDIDNFDDLERPDSFYIGSNTPSTSSYPASPSSLSSSMVNYFDADPIAGDYCDTAHLSPPQSPFPAFHLPSPKTYPSWDSLSDLPSLKSSASNSSLSTTSISRPPSTQHHLCVSPATSYFPTPADMSPRIQSLDVIEEVRIPEELGHGMRYPVTAGNRSFTVIQKEEEQQATIRAHGYARDRRALPQLETLKIETQESINTKPLPRSPAPSTGGDSSSSHHSSRTAGGAFSRLFHKNSTSSSDNKQSNKTSSHSRSSESVNCADPGESILEIGLTKAEEKKKKKELAKQRTERLAIELKEKSKKRAAEAAAARAARGPKKASLWEEEGGMWGGGGGFGSL